VPSQSTASRFFGVFTPPANDRLARLHGWAGREAGWDRDSEPANDLAAEAFSGDGSDEAEAQIGKKPKFRWKIVA